MKFQEFFQTDNSSGGTSELTDEQILDSNLSELGIEESEEEEEEEEEESEESEEEDSEENIEEESEEEKESVIEASTEEQQITFRNIKKEFPEFFKKFPEIGKELSKVRQYEQVFSSPEEAQNVQARSEVFEGIVAELSIGSPISLLKELSENEEATIEFSRNILPALHKLHPNLFHEATTPVVTHLLKNAIKSTEGKEDQYSKNLRVAAQFLSHWLFGTVNIPDSNRRGSKEIDPEKTQLLNERKQFLEAQEGKTATEINNTLKTEITKSVNSFLKNIKSLSSQPKYVQEKLYKDIVDAIDSEMTSDENFMRGQRSLWQKAARTGFNDVTTISRIKSAYLERGKNLVERVAKSILKQSGLVKMSPSTRKLELSKMAPDSGNRGRRINVGKIKASQVDYSRTSDLDILNDNVRLKGQK